MTSKYKKFALIVSDTVIFLSGLTVVAITLFDFSGALAEMSWLSDRIDIITLLAVGLVLLSISIERRLSLESISERIRTIEQAGSFGSYYIPDTSETIKQLERLSNDATECLMSIGSKSSANKYLRNIERQVKKDGFVYYRLLDGSYITHNLHEHLDKIIERENVHIAWTEREKFGNIVIIEDKTLIAFPTPREDKFSCLMLPGNINSRIYTQYFMEAYSVCQTITNREALKVLCRDCSESISGNVKKIREKLSELEPNIIQTKISLRPDLLS